MSSIRLPFTSRSDAGELLAEELMQYKDADDAVILALVRGGVEVGAQLRDALHLPLLPYVVRKIGHPGHREYGVGAIAEGGATYLDAATMQIAGLTLEDLEPVIAEETKELKRRTKAYRRDPLPDLAGRTVILTDDGAATGGTLFAAIADMRKAPVASVVVALPVCPPDTARELEKRADRAVILATPEHFDAVGKWYKDFPQVEDSEVHRLLQSTAA